MGKQTVLVTGGCGYIGSHVVRKLTEGGAKVVVIDNLSTGFAGALLHGETLIQGDIGNRTTIERVFAEHHIDAIIHFAAKIRVEESVSDPYLYYSNNTVNTLELIAAAVRHKVPKFIFSSTAATYGQPDHVPVDETAPLRPASPYGASKMMSERVLQDIAAAFPAFRFVILRYFNVAGADLQLRMGQRSPEATHLIKVACQVALGRRPALQLYGTDYQTVDGTCVRDYIHVEDLASAHLAALTYLNEGSESTILNCGYGHGSSVRAVLKAVQEVSGNSFKVIEAPRRPGDVAEIVANVDKIHRLLDWRPQYDDLKTIVQHAYAWEKNLPTGNT